jgi:hypothetical protein
VEEHKAKQKCQPVVKKHIGQARAAEGWKMGWLGLSVLFISHPGPVPAFYIAEENHDYSSSGIKKERG